MSKITKSSKNFTALSTASSLLRVPGSKLNYYIRAKYSNIQKNKIMIKSIEKETIHKICSGQVIVDLATAVKELVVPKYNIYLLYLVSLCLINSN